MLNQYSIWWGRKRKRFPELEIAEIWFKAAIVWVVCLIIWIAAIFVVGGLLNG